MPDQRRLPNGNQIGPRCLPVKNPREPAEPIGDGRALHQAGDDRERCGNEHRDKVEELLQAVVTRLAVIGGEVHRQTLK